MRACAVLLGAIVLSTVGAGAQESSVSPASQTTSSGAAGQASVLAAMPTFALATSPAMAAPEAFPSPAPSLAAPGGGPPQQPAGVYGVFRNFAWQLYAGYSFMRFYVASSPDIQENSNGLDVGAVYFPRQDWLGIEGQFVGEYGSLFSRTTKLAAGMGGPRFRWATAREIQIWAHGLAGGAKFLPATAIGGTGAFAFEAGGGVDLGTHRRRWAYRVEADVVGTRFFNTYQYSPRIAGGIIYKFGERR